MKNKKLSVFLAALILLGSLFSIVNASRNPITLEAAIGKALTNSPDIIKYNDSITKLERQYKDAVISSQSIKDLLEMNEKYSRFSEEKKYELSLSSELNDDNIEYIIDTNKAMLQSNKNNIVLKLNQLFMQWRKTNNSINNQSMLVSSLERSLFSAKAKLAYGKASIKEIEQLNLELKSANIALNNLKRQNIKTEISINKLTGEAVNTRYDEYQINENLQSLNLGNIEDYVTAALGNRLDIKAADKFYGLKKTNFDITKRYYYFDTNVNNKAAWVEMNNAADNLESTRLQAQIQVMNAYEQLENQLNTIESSKQELDASFLKFNEAQKKSSMGLATELEAANAYMEYIKCKSKYEGDLNDGWYKKLQLDNVCGIKLYNEQ